MSLWVTRRWDSIPTYKYAKYGDVRSCSRFLSHITRCSYLSQHTNTLTGTTEDGATRKERCVFLRGAIVYYGENSTSSCSCETVTLRQRDVRGIRACSSNITLSMYFNHFTFMFDLCDSNYKNITVSFTHAARNSQEITRKSTLECVLECNENWSRASRSNTGIWCQITCRLWRCSRSVWRTDWTMNVLRT